MGSITGVSRYTRIMIKKGPDAYSTSWIENEDFSPFSLVLMTEEDVRRAFQHWTLREVYPVVVPLPRGGGDGSLLEPHSYEFWDRLTYSITGKEAYSVLTYLWTPEHGWLVKDSSETKWMDKSGWETLDSHLVKRALF